LAVKIIGKRGWLLRFVDDEGEVLDMLVQKRRNTGTALRFLRRLLKRQGVHRETIITESSPRIGPRPRNLVVAVATDQGE
jgi:putative transposase